MFIIFILYHILYIIFQIKKQKNQFISLPIEEGDFLIRLLKDGVHIRTLSYIFMGIANFVGLQAIFIDNITEEEIDILVKQAIFIIQNGAFK
jgi:hypothetical protein